MLMSFPNDKLTAVLFSVRDITVRCGVQALSGRLCVYTCTCLCMTVQAAIRDRLSKPQHRLDVKHNFVDLARIKFIDPRVCVVYS